MIQYPEAAVINREAAAYWIARLRGRRRLEFGFGAKKNS